MRGMEEMEIPGFDDLNLFLRYCESHSKTPRASFSGVYVNCLCDLMGEELAYTDKELKNNPFDSIHSEEMGRILRIIKNQRNSIESTCEEISGKVSHLDNYR